MNKNVVIICIITAIPLLALSIYNIRTNGLAFFDASIVNVMTIFIAVIISYFFVQRKNDQRKQKDILVDLIFKLQKQITSPEAYDFSGQDKPVITMRNRDISNKIEILKETQNIFSTQKEVEFICEKFEEYTEFIGNHITDLEYLINSKNDLKRPLDLINNKLTSMAISLYK